MTLQCPPEFEGRETGWDDDWEEALQSEDTEDNIEKVVLRFIDEASSSS